MKKVIWIPSQHGEAPPKYHENMEVVTIAKNGVKFRLSRPPHWFADTQYLVPEEALNPAYATHVPKFKGDAPKNWQKGMWWSLISENPRDRVKSNPEFDSVGETYYVPAEAVEPPPTITQVELDALWLAARLTVNLPDVPESLAERAANRILTLKLAGVIDVDNDGKAYVL